MSPIVLGYLFKDFFHKVTILLLRKPDFVWQKTDSKNFRDMIYDYEVFIIWYCSRFDFSKIFHSVIFLRSQQVSEKVGNSVFEEVFDSLGAHPW